MIERQFDINSMSVRDYVSALEAHVKNEVKPVYDFGNLTIRTNSNVYAKEHNIVSVKEELDSLTVTGRRIIIDILEKQFEVKKQATLKDFDSTKAKCDFVFEKDKEYATLVSQFNILLPCQASQMMKDFLAQKLKRRSSKSLVFQARINSYANGNSQVSC